MEKLFANYYVLPGNFYPIKKLKNYTDLGMIRNYERRDSVVLPGEKIDRIIYVVSGRLSINFLNDDGRQKLMFYADPYTFADRLFQVDDCYVHVVSEEKSTVCFFAKERLLEVFQKDKEVLCEFITSYASKCGYFMREAKEMALYNSSARVLRFLYNLCLTKGKLVDNVYEINMKLPQKAISEITGVHHVTISKIFGSLKKANVLRKTSNKIIVSDVTRLKDLMNECIEC
ncbi:MAG: Cyclic AMP receptor-like protein [Candidatus Dichloromethanomonas elyunquensis]|nr:MAG: Cyclic AMP receptor-like protein [Candidatus Dichloromethanomonas elyunquensis]